MAKFEKAIEPSGHTGTFNLRMIGVSERAREQNKFRNIISFAMHGFI